MARHVNTLVVRPKKKFTLIPIAEVIFKISKWKPP